MNKQLIDVLKEHMKQVVLHANTTTLDKNLVVSILKDLKDAKKFNKKVSSDVIFALIMDLKEALHIANGGAYYDREQIEKLDTVIN